MNRITKILFCSLLAFTVFYPTVNAIIAQCLLQKALNPKYTYIPDTHDPRKDKLQIDLTVVIKHKDGEITHTPLNKPVTIDTSNALTHKELYKLIGQTIFHEMLTTAQAVCSERGCNK